MKRTSHFYLLILFLLFSSSAESQTGKLGTVLKLKDAFAFFDITTVGPDTTAMKRIRDLDTLLGNIRDSEFENRQFKGKVNFGFMGNTTNAVEYSDPIHNRVANLNGGITLKKGQYRSEVKLNTQLNVSSVNGVLTENISNLNLSYDRFFLSEKPMLLEGYAFVNRRQDLFMGVDQRYEIGGGIILAYWLKTKAIQAKRKKIEETFEKFKSEQKTLYDCLETCTAIDVPITKEEFKQIADFKDQLIYRAIKKDSPLRVGLLVGVFAELERLNFNGNFSPDTLLKDFTFEFPSTTRFRWEVRPTLDFKIIKITSVKLRPYFKFPFPREWKVASNGEEKFDYRVDFPIQIDIKVSGDFSIGVQHTIYFDNTPGIVTSTVMGLTGEPLVAATNRWHQFTSFNMALSF